MVMHLNIERKPGMLINTEGMSVSIGRMLINIQSMSTNIGQMLIGILVSTYKRDSQIKFNKYILLNLVAMFNLKTKIL